MCRRPRRLRIRLLRACRRLRARPYPTGAYPPYGPPARGTNGFAIASLVCSIVACGVGSVLGIVFGHIARRQIRRTGEGGNGLAIVGMVVGYVGVAALATMILAVAVLFTNQGEGFARDEARGSTVASPATPVSWVDAARPAHRRSCPPELLVATVTIGDPGCGTRRVRGRAGRRRLAAAVQLPR